MSYDAQIKEIRNCAKSLLEQGKVDLILGYGEGGFDGLSAPLFVRKPENCDKLIWGDRCWQNLSGYLCGRSDKVGVVAKPCDVRGIVQLVIEGQIQRENVYIIGADCLKIVDSEGKLRPGCEDCTIHSPPIYDTYIQDERVQNLEPNQETTEEYSLERFQNEIDKCILCFACRQACYGCYCNTCFMDRGVPNWLPGEVDSGAKMVFHLGKAMHLAGRCVECGSCDAVCASGVHLRYIIKEVTRFVEETYDFKTGLDLDTKPAMMDFSPDDEDTGFLGR